MGSFSWLKADNLTKIGNIASDMPYKMLIPAEFGGGFIKDRYQGYGHIGEKEHAICKHDMYELLAFWNADMVISCEHLHDSKEMQYLEKGLRKDIINCHNVRWGREAMRVINVLSEFNKSPDNTIAVKDLLFGYTPDNRMKEYDNDTFYNRNIGIIIGCHDSEIRKLRYPLKLVSASYNGTYEECEGISLGDPHQGFKPVPRGSEYDMFI